MAAEVRPVRNRIRPTNKERRRSSNRAVDLVGISCRQQSLSLVFLGKQTQYALHILRTYKSALFSSSGASLGSEWTRWRPVRKITNSGKQYARAYRDSRTVGCCEKNLPRYPGMMGNYGRLCHIFIRCNAPSCRWLVSITG